LIPEGRHPGRSVSEDPGSPAVDIGRRCRIGVRHDEIYYVIKHKSLIWNNLKQFSQILIPNRRYLIYMHHLITEERVKKLTNLRQKLHRIPEASGEEMKTAGLIEKELRKTKSDQLITGIGGHGIAAIYKGINPGRGMNLMIRCELDGLKIREETKLAYQSVHENRMHACGHDGHMAIVTGLAGMLDQQRPKTGSVILLYQPAEETGEGAEKVLSDPKFENLKIDRAVALHNLPGFKKGAIYIRSKTFAAASVGIRISLKGESSHAAYPAQGINPAGEIARVVESVRQINSANSKKDQLSVATVTFIKLGEEAFGISPGNGEIGVTLRAETDELLENMQAKLMDDLASIKKEFKGEITGKFTEPFAATVNDREGVKQFKSAVEDVAKIEKLDRPFPWSEDFGVFRKKCPITLFGIGSGKKSKPLHSEYYNFDDTLIPAGIRVFAALIDYHLNS